MFRIKQLAALAIMALAALTFAACADEQEGGGDPTATSPPSGDPTATSPATNETATATPSEGQTPPPDNGEGPSGMLVAALDGVGTPIGTPELCVPDCANEQYFFSVWETPLHWTENEELGPGIVESWDLADDLSKFTWHIRQGIQFHDDWGEVTAEDLAWTTNSVNSNTNPDSVHDVAGDMSCCYGETVAIDTYVAETEITNYDSRAPGWLFSNLRDSFGVSSKAIFDEFGRDGMRQMFIGTGPYRMVEWVEGDHVLLEALDEHYRNTAEVQTVRIVDVPEEASRIAMFEGRQADITHVELPNVRRLEDAGGIKRELETSLSHIAFAPNFLETTNPKNGEPLENPGFDPSLPWVTNPFAEGCNYDQLWEVVPSETPCDEMENPRKVRLAMAMAINKDDLVEGLLDNLGWPACDWAISTQVPEHKDEWCIPYDPDQARQLMAEAGYEDGFEVTMWAGGDEPDEIHEAVTSMWQQELGITTRFETGPFSVWQPTFIDRSLQALVIDGEQGGMPVDFAKGREAQAWFEGGIMWSGGIPFFQQIYGDMLTEPDRERRLELAEQFGDHNRHWVWEIGVWEQPIYTVYNGERIEWNPRSGSIHTQIGNYVFPLEDITLKE